MAQQIVLSRFIGNGESNVTSVIEIIKADGKKERRNVIFGEEYKITLNYGDRIICVLGRIILFVYKFSVHDLGRAHLLAAQPQRGIHEKYEVLLNETTVKPMHHDSYAAPGVNDRRPTGRVIR